MYECKNYVSYMYWLCNFNLISKILHCEHHNYYVRMNVTLNINTIMYPKNRVTITKQITSATATIIISKIDKTTNNKLQQYDVCIAENEYWKVWLIFPNCQNSAHVHIFLLMRKKMFFCNVNADVRM